MQFNFEDMKNYCSKETEFVLPEYSGKICKHDAEIVIASKWCLLFKSLALLSRYRMFLVFLQ